MFVNLKNACFLKYNVWLFPLYFTSVTSEYSSIKSQISLLNNDYWRYLDATGHGLTSFLNIVFTINKKKINDARFFKSILLNTKGYVIGDIFIYKTSKYNMLFCIDLFNYSKIKEFILNKLYLYNIANIVIIEKKKIISFFIKYFLDTEIIDLICLNYVKAYKSSFLLQHFPCTNFVFILSKTNYLSFSLSLIIFKRTYLSSFIYFTEYISVLLSLNFCGTIASHFLHIEYNMHFLYKNIQYFFKTFNATIKSIIILKNKISIYFLKLLTYRIQHICLLKLTRTVNVYFTPANMHSFLFNRDIILGRVFISFFNPYFKYSAVICILIYAHVNDENFYFLISLDINKHTFFLYTQKTLLRSQCFK